MKKEYKGYELGPIRPPSEAESLLLRVSRNCSWNKCKFCALFKGEKFTTRPKEHVYEDIDLLKKNIDFIKKLSNLDEDEKKSKLIEFFKNLTKDEQWAFYSADSWFQHGMKSVFLQDGNSLVIKTNDLIDILKYLKKTFPHEKRITSYARSTTISKIPDEKLKELVNVGLNRVHVGMESANDKILEIIKKGVTKALHVKAGQKIKKAGIELSEYYMPGVGGKEYFEVNALDTADAINQINPDFIRIRTFALKENQELYYDYENGTLIKMGDIDVVKELILFIENLHDIDSIIKSDHILNLLPDVEGSIRENKKRMLKKLNNFLDLDRNDQIIYQVGRRVGYMRNIADLKNIDRRQATLDIIRDENINEETIDDFVIERLNQFI